MYIVTLHWFQEMQFVYVWHIKSRANTELNISEDISIYYEDKVSTWNNNSCLIRFPKAMFLCTGIGIGKIIRNWLSSKINIYIQGVSKIVWIGLNEKWLRNLEIFAYYIHIFTQNFSFSSKKKFYAKIPNRAH